MGGDDFTAAISKYNPLFRITRASITHIRADWDHRKNRKDIGDITMYARQLQKPHHRVATSDQITQSKKI
jgi:hypothetical protein